MKLVLALALTAAVQQSGCSAVSGLPDTSAVRFEVEYTNYAWTPTWQGFAIHEDGRITRYDVGTATPPDEGGAYVSAQDLDAKWSLRSQPHGSVAADEFIRMRALAQDATAQLGQPQHRCADFGQVTYTAYVFDRARGRYRRVVLLREGDVAQQNSSAAASELAEWLRDFEFFQVPEGCRA